MRVRSVTERRDDLTRLHWSRNLMPLVSGLSASSRRKRRFADSQSFGAASEADGYGSP